MSSSRIDLSVILVNYNAAQLTAQAVDSVLRTTCCTSLEIIVVENGANSEERYQSNSPFVKVLRNIDNKGYGHACNQGVAASTGLYILFLNNDTIVHWKTIDDTVSYLKKYQKKVGALGVQLLLPTGELDHGCKRGFPTPLASFCYFSKLDNVFPQNKIISAYRQSFIANDIIAEVDAVSGAFLMLSRHLFEELGGFDETFFMYGEDLDLCYRIKQLGYQNIYYGKASITHLKGQSGLYKNNEKVLDAFYQAMELFYNKHYRQKYDFFLTLLIQLAIRLKHRIARLKKGEKVE